ncbi:MAG: hypothetical protein ACYDCK_04345 [Thermoplasmatota archaeon]
MRFALVFGIVAILALAGCLSGATPKGAPAEKAASNAPTATAADATTTGAAIAAPSKPFQADSVANSDPNTKTSTTIYPFVPHGQRDKAAQRIVLKGTFNATDCTVPVANFFSPQLGSGQYQPFDLKKYFEAGDTFDMNETMTWTNTASDAADLHLFSFLPTDSFYHTAPTYGTTGPVTIMYDAQQAWPNDATNAYAWVGAVCFYATNAQPIDYTITLTITYLRGIAPAHTPVLLHVSQNVTELIASEVGITPAARVTAHYRIFDPDDKLLGSFALHSDGSAVRIPVKANGDYVLLVDHSENGYVAIGANAPPADNEMIFLKTQWAQKPLVNVEQPGPAAITATFVLPRVPLTLYVYPAPAAQSGVALLHNFDLKVKGPLGPVEDDAIPGEAILHLPICNSACYFGLPIPGWGYSYDHHALAAGEHTVNVNADEFSGSVYVSMMSYLRPGDTQVPQPIVGGGTASDAGSASELPINGLL